MWNRTKAIHHLVQNANDHSLGKCAHYVREAVEAGGVTLLRHTSAKDYGSSLRIVGFQNLPRPGLIKFPLAGDVAIIQPIRGHPYGHMCMFSGKIWISDFKQWRGMYPGSSYRRAKPSFAIYRYPFVGDFPVSTSQLLA